MYQALLLALKYINSHFHICYSTSWNNFLFQELFNELVLNENISLNEIGKKIIFHIDFDYFYAQCEEIRKPELRNIPSVVCVYSGREEDSGVVSTCNYESRKYGV